MWYSRDDSFLGLSELIGLLGDDADLSDYVAYLRLRGQGRRKDAFVRLGHFIEIAEGWALRKRCDLVDRLMSLQYDRPRVDEMLPTPLRRRIISPTLDEWVATEPMNPLPWRWRGEPDDLRRAISLDPGERIARVRLVQRFLADVKYATHELPYGYLGSPFEDTAKLEEVAVLLEGLPFEDASDPKQQLAELRGKIQSHIRSIEDGDP